MDTPNSKGKSVEMVSNLYRFEHGCYTMTDMQLAADSASNGYCLDVLLFFGEFNSWNVDSGGYISYIACNEPDEVNLLWKCFMLNVIQF